jgi:hypothetical protein
MILAEMSRNLILQQATTEAQSQRLTKTLQDYFPDAMIIRTQAQTLRNLPKTPVEVLETLRQHTPAFALQVLQNGGL